MIKYFDTCLYNSLSSGDKHFSIIAHGTEGVSCYGIGKSVPYSVKVIIHDGIGKHIPVFYDVKSHGRQNPEIVVLIKINVVVIAVRESGNRLQSSVLYILNGVGSYYPDHIPLFIFLDTQNDVTGETFFTGNVCNLFILQDKYSAAVGTRIYFAVGAFLKSQNDTVGETFFFSVGFRHPSVLDDRYSSVGTYQYFPVFGFGCTSDSV